MTAIPQGVFPRLSDEAARSGHGRWQNLSPRQVRRFLGKLRARWGQAAGPLRHEQGPVKVSREAVLLDLKGKARTGRIKLAAPDVVDPSPASPIASSGSLPGPRIIFPLVVRAYRDAMTTDRVAGLTGPERRVAR